MSAIGTILAKAFNGLQAHVFLPASLALLSLISIFRKRPNAISMGPIPANTATPRLETTGRQLLTLEKDGPIQMGFWVPNRVYATVKYLVPLRQHIETLRAQNALRPVHDTISTFKQFIEANGIYRMLVNRMLDEANAFIATCDPATIAEIQAFGDTTVYSYDDFFTYLNEIINTTPSFNDTAQVGTPMNGLLAVAMGTPSGADLFHDSTFNAQFKLVLDAWNSFLKSPQSLDKLDIQNPEKQGSWISQAAFAAGVWNQMSYDPTEQGFGYESWNDFFIRPFVPGARPFLGDPTVSVDVGCETTPWSYANNVGAETPFWIKDVEYSLFDLFGGQQDKADLFTGGQVYQGFLSATHYHRWSAPLDGQLIESWVQPGTYFAQRPDQGEGVGTWEGTESQPYLGHVASRAIFVFLHPTCGYVALICIGMVEVSTCVIAPDCLVPSGSAPLNITRGTEIGHFEFGGSTHIMVFQNGKVTLADWAVNAAQHQNDPQPTPMGTVIATAIVG
ncbi:Phophatidylserine decarboxylase-domain-containing protein [Ephemerocybe angulata]|uniref:Phophatidylserine decarboxylase-domain-containing protein n=1 Tax=Ephemerocybe angulata TaxID=980116 RepID=A0A8H6HEP4_9AGAR|nr:Phophatidylserine decarboxylase-domain-containing protein [Tulosesus angulatus]